MREALPHGARENSGETLPQGAREIKGRISRRG